VIGCRIPCLSARQGASQAGRWARGESFGRRKLERDAVAFVEGRRPGSDEAIAFDEAAVDAEPGGVSWAWPKGWVRCNGCNIGRQRLCTRARCAEENAVTGRLRAEELRPMLHQDCAGSSFRVGIRATAHMSPSASRGYAEAGASPSSEASSEDLPEAIGRRWISTKRGAARPVGWCARKSDSPEGARFVSRLQKLVRRIFLARPPCEATRRRNGRIA